jgi:hypothetical protein
MWPGRIWSLLLPVTATGHETWVGGCLEQGRLGPQAQHALLGEGAAVCPTKPLQRLEVLPSGVPCPCQLAASLRTHYAEVMPAGVCCSLLLCLAVVVPGLLACLTAWWVRGA